VAPVSKLKMPLHKFVSAHKDYEDDVNFLARIDLDVEGIVGSYTCPEHEVCIAGLPNGGRLNHMFELTGVAYRPHPVPGSDAFTEALKKRKVDATGKAPVKCPRASGNKKGESAKASASWENASLK
jgi:poly(3-hydroxybutyrate) depolymerase